MALKSSVVYLTKSQVGFQAGVNIGEIMIRVLTNLRTIFRSGSNRVIILETTLEMTAISFFLLLVPKVLVKDTSL